MEFDKVIRERQSTRKFKEEKVSDELINKILEAGVIAPTAKNIQPEIIYVVKSEEGLKKMDDVSPCRYKAPQVLIVCGDKDKAFQKNGESIYYMDACIVGTHMMLEATNVGVDNIWIEMFDTDKLIDGLSIPEGLIPVLMLPIGYKAKLCPPSPLHKIRKNIDKIVEYK